ncbi:MAG: peptidylprolyl isomerase [Actinomycetota bacterium]
MRRVLFWFAAVAILPAACGNLLEPAAAVVRGEKIPVSRVEAALDRFTASDQFQQLAEQNDAQVIRRQFEQGFLSQLVRRAVLEPKAEELGLSVTDADVTERLDQIQADFPSQSAFEEAVREQGLTLDQLDEIIYDQILIDRLRTEVTADLGASEDRLRTYYEENIADYRESEAQHILVAERGLAQRISSMLRDAREARVDDLFRRLAARHSQDESNAKNAGRLGFFASGQFVPEFEQAADALEVGEISEPVRSQFGFHVIRVTDRRARAFEEARDEIEQQLGGTIRDEAWEEYLEDVYAEAEVKVNPRYGEFDVASQLIVDATADSAPGAATPSPGRAPAESAD